MMDWLVPPYYEWVKAAHVIFVIFWMAGMFMLPRYFAYHCEAAAGSAILLYAPRAPTKQRGQDHALYVLPNSRRIEKDIRMEFATHRRKTTQTNIAAHRINSANGLDSRRDEA